MDCQEPSRFETRPQSAISSAEEVRHENLWRLARQEDFAEAASLRAHLVDCAGCRRLFNSFQELGRALRRTGPVVLAVCPSAEELADYRDQKLVPSEASRLSAHLAACPPCREDLDWLERTAEPAAPKVVTLSRRRWLFAGAAAAAVAVVSAPAVRYLRRPAGSPFSDLAETLELDRDVLMEGSNGEQFASILQAAYQDFGRGDYVSADGRAKAVLSEAPSNPGAFYLLAMTQYKRGQYQEAARLMDKAESIRPKSAGRCWAALQMALLTGDTSVIDTECRHLSWHKEYAEKARKIRDAVSQRIASNRIPLSVLA